MLSDRGKSIDQSGISRYSKMFYDIVVPYHQNNKNFISLSHGNPLLNCPISLETAFASVKENMDFIKQYFPYPHILPDVKDCIHQYLLKSGFTKNDGMDITVGHGVINLIQSCITVLANPGDKILINSPFYGLIDWIVKITSNELIPLPGDESNEFKINPDDLDNTLTKNPNIKILLFVNPHNPTGHVYTRKELQNICTVLKRHPDVIVIANEIYCNLTYGNQFISIGNFSDLAHRTIILRGFSKDLGLAKERIGFAFGPKEIIDKINLFYIGSSNGVSYSGQKIIQHILKEEHENYFFKSNSMYKNNLNKVFRFLQIINKSLNIKHNTIDIFYLFPINKPRSGFFLCIDFSKWCKINSIKTDFELMEILLKKTAISLAPGCLFDWPTENCILRITYSHHKKTLNLALEELKNFFLDYLMD